MKNILNYAYIFFQDEFPQGFFKTLSLHVQFALIFFILWTFSDSYQLRIFKFFVKSLRSSAYNGGDFVTYDFINAQNDAIGQIV